MWEYWQHKLSKDKRANSINQRLDGAPSPSAPVGACQPLQRYPRCACSILDCSVDEALPAAHPSWHSSQNPSHCIRLRL